MTYGWIKGVREVRMVTVAADGTLVGMRRGPVMTREERVATDLNPEAWARLVHYNVTLPLAAGAGPCGTRARYPIPDPLVTRNTRWCGSPLTWSIRHLIMPLRAYYASYVPPIRLGAKGTPRGRRLAA